MDTSELRFWVAFGRIPGVGPATVAKLERRFGALSEAWRAGAGELAQAGLDQRAVQAIVGLRPTVDPDQEMALLSRHGIQSITWNDSRYPARLREIHDPPPVLYVLGELRPEDERSVAVVGTRRATAYGHEAARSLCRGLVEAGVTIVSGLARGIDAVAHKAALEAGGRTVAVMGSGLDVMYPREHAGLADEIARNGALVSEYPLGTRPKADNFPRRNRIMSGMTLGTLVVEAPEGSGALITAALALEQDREVFAVPGNIFAPASRGANNLIKASGAKLVSHPNDILEELNLSVVGQQLEMTAMFPVEDSEAQLLKYVSYDPIHIDEIARSSGMGISQVSGALTIMELKGLVRQVGGMNYVKLKEEPARY